MGRSGMWWDRPLIDNLTSKMGREEVEVVLMQAVLCMFLLNFVQFIVRHSSHVKIAYLYIIIGMYFILSELYLERKAIYVPAIL